MRVSEEGVALIKKFEGCELESYKCPAGVWTIGYGYTKKVKEGVVISKEEAEKLLREDIEEFEGYVKNLVHVDLEQCQYDAFVSWVFNLGPTNLKNSSLLRILNSTHVDWADIPYQIQRWNKVNGVPNEGLKKRRKAEALLFQGQEWGKV